MKKKTILLGLTSFLLLGGCTNRISSSDDESQSSASSSNSTNQSSSDSSSKESSSSLNGSSSSEDITSSNSDPISEFKVIFESTSDYDISGLKDKYSVGENVSFTITIKNEKKEIKEVKANETLLNRNDDGSYSFAMPNEEVTIKVTLQDKKEEIRVATKYDVKYVLSGKTAKKLDSDSSIFDCFIKEGDEEGLINSISSFDYIYGGGNGRTESTWYSGDMIKFGTTSVNGSLTFDLKYEVNKIKITGYTYETTSKVQIGVSNSVDFGGENNKKTTTITNSAMKAICKSVVDAKEVNTVEIEFDSTKSLKIATLNKKPLFITGIEFFLTNSAPINTYTVTWKNYDGTILKIDNDVIEGSIPSYQGETPFKPNEGDKSYKFIGWDPEPNKIYKDATYTAVFREITLVDPSLDFSPSFSNDGKNVYYGYYPKSHVKDVDLISSLETTTSMTSNGWYVYNNEFYTKIDAYVFADEDYYFDEGSKIISGDSYWFKCENIKWNIISKGNNSFQLLSDDLLDTGCFYPDYEDRTINNEPVYANSYLYSKIRNWLNSDFLETAFSFDSAYINEMEIDNSASTTDSGSNKYVSGNSIDKVYLLSYQDYLNEDYGFTSESGSSSSRAARTTDYARARGAWYNKGNNSSSLKFNGSYWTRSPSSEYYYTAKNINSSGFISDYAVDGTSHCIRPSITISF